MPKRTEDNIEVGARFINKVGDWFSIKSIKNMKNIVIEFDGYEDFPTVRSKWLIETGQVKNYFKPSLYGIGFVGEGGTKAGKGLSSYTVWSCMLGRCYNPSVREYNRYGGRGITVCDEWHNYQNFRSWYDKYYIDGYQVDKDLKVPDSKQYSPDTCIFISSEVNKLLISNNKFRSEYGVGVHPRPNGKFQAAYSCFSKITHLGTFDTADEAFLAYKEAKESHIRVMADLHREVLHKDAYNTLMNWEVLRFPE